MTRTNLPNLQDEWLANFADQVLEGKVQDLSTVDADAEMRALADTILQLKAAFPAEAANAASMKRMQTRVMTHAREEQERKARWSKFTGSEWFTQRRPRLAVAAMLAALVLAVVTGPALFSATGSNTTVGTAINAGWILWILLGLVLAAGLWLTSMTPPGMF